MTSEEKIITDIKEFGWHIINVFEGENNYQFSYTIGLYKSFGVPELFLSGLEGEVAVDIINSIVDDIKEGKLIESNTENTDYFNDYICYFSLVDELYYDQFFGKAVWFYKGKNFPVLQCVWPDKEHNFPWETQVIFNQDILFKPTT